MYGAAGLGGGLMTGRSVTEVDVEREGSDVGVDGGEGAPRMAEEWRRAYARRLAVSDLAVLLWVVVGGQLVLSAGGVIPDPTEGAREAILSVGFPLFVLITWQAALALADTRSDRVVGQGSQEFERVFDATFMVFGTIATVAFVFGVEAIRPFLFLTVPFGLLVLFVERWLWRQWLRFKREDGEYGARVLLVGSPQSVEEISTELARARDAGYFIVGACVPDGVVGQEVPGTDVPIVGDAESSVASAAATGADTVIITSADVLSPHRVQEIGWELQPGSQHLVLAPSIVGIAGHRLHTRAVAGLPLVHVETPQLSPADRFTKRAFDVLVSGALIVVASPILLAVALAVKVTSPGPLLYRSQRIGLRGEPFAMLKFRSMRQGADKELKKLLEAQGTAETPLFKVKDDPRITPIGKVLRKYSLDELPQLFNVLGGSMSLVGPRPQIEAEVAMYTDSARRRLLTRPGVTGLWQVSGRSMLTWDDAVRLDLFYVENWSLLGDVEIMLRTFKAVVVPGETAH